MARFRYLGEPPRSYVTAYGPTILIKVQKKDGTQQTLTPVPPATSFVIGQDLGYNITDERSVRQLRADPRYEEIV
jgi:hypothetical protein